MQNKILIEKISKINTKENSILDLSLPIEN